jgi:CubicO group peptidase (beta-lactamase class C family)
MPRCANLLPRRATAAFAKAPLRLLRPAAALVLPAAILLALPGSGAARQGADALSRVDSVFVAVADPAGPGCALAVVQDGRFAFSRGYGTANLDYGVPIDGRSVFYLASVSKQFTAAAVALAAAEEHLSLDDDVRRWLPEVPDYGTPITIRHLVHHTSGLRDYLTLIALAGRRADDHWTDAALAELIVRQQSTNFPPGTEFLYSNTGYVMLADVVGRATGSSLRQYADSRIFQPLGMASTHFHDDAGRVVPRRVIGYGRGADGEFRLNHWFAFDKVGDGGLYASAEDLARWEENFFSGRVGGATFLARIHQRGILSSGDSIPYAFGLTHGTYRGLPTVGHGGSLAGFRTMVLRFPEQRFSSIVLCNTPSANPTLLAQRTAEIFLDGAMAPPATPQGQPATAQTAAAPALPAAAAAAMASGLGRYTGRFHSEELDAVYTLVEEGGTLVVRRGADTRIPLRATEADVFAAATGLVLRFEGGAAAPGGAASFTIDAGRVRGIRFLRIGDG